MSDTEGVTVANAFVQIMPSMEGATDSITNAIMPSMQASGTKAGSTFGSTFKGKAGALLKGAGVAALGYMAFDNLTDTFGTVEGGFNNVVVATGATGEAAESLKKVYLQASKSVVGDFGSIGEAVGELNTRLGTNGDELEGATEQAMKFAKVNGVDAKTAVQDVTKMMNDAGIPAEDFGKTLDTLTVAAQASGIDVGKLTQSVTANSASFKAMGLDTNDAIAMLANFEKTGADTSTILSGMKKGVAAWSAEGVSAKEGFESFVSGVADGSVTAQDAIDLFGSRAGVAMFDAAQKGQLNFADMYSAINENSDGALDSVYESTLTAQEKFDLLGQKVSAGFYEIIDPLVTAITPYMDDILDAVGGAVQWVVEVAGPAVKGIIDGVGAAITVLAEIFGPPIETILGFVGDVVDNFTSMDGSVEGVFKAIGDTVVDAVDTIGELLGFEGLGDIVEDVFEGVQSFIEDPIGTAQDAVSDAAEAIGDFLGFDGLGDVVDDVFDGVQGFIEDPLGTAQGAVEDAVDAIAGFLGFDNVADTVDSVFSGIQGFIEDPIGTAKETIGGLVEDIAGFLGFDGVDLTVSSVFDTIQGFIEDPIGSAKETIDGIIGDIENAFSWMKIEIPGFKLPHVSWDWKKVGPVDIPWNFRVDWYARGGVVDGATLIGAGEAGPEAIVPLTEPNIKPFTEGVANKLDDKLMQAMRQMRLVMNIDGRAFAEATVGEIDRAMGAMNRRSNGR